MTRLHKKTFSWFLWHRRIGLLSVLLMIILAITGIALNHTEELQLDQKIIRNDSILNWYGLNPKGPPISFPLDKTRITQWGDKLFYNDRIVTNSLDTLVGAVRSGNNILVIAFTNSLLLLDSEGEMIEQISPDFVPIIKLGLKDGEVIAKSTTGDQYRADQNIVSWQADAAPAIDWSHSIELESEWQQKIKLAWRGNGLTIERVILDLHSGRIFNARWGVYIMDAGAIFMLLLSMSGGWMWWTRKQKIAGKKHFQKHHR